MRGENKACRGVGTASVISLSAPWLYMRQVLLTDITSWKRYELATNTALPEDEFHDNNSLESSATFADVITAVTLLLPSVQTAAICSCRGDMATKSDSVLSGYVVAAMLSCPSFRGVLCLQHLTLFPDKADSRCPKRRTHIPSWLMRPIPGDRFKPVCTSVQLGTLVTR